MHRVLHAKTIHPVLKLQSVRKAGARTNLIFSWEGLLRMKLKVTLISEVVCSAPEALRRR